MLRILEGPLDGGDRARRIDPEVIEARLALIVADYKDARTVFSDRLLRCAARLKAGNRRA